MALQWTCPFCGRNATIIDDNLSEARHEFNHGNKDGWQAVRTQVIVCPNAECHEYSLSVTLHDQRVADGAFGDLPAKQTWQLIPAARMKVFPDYVPEPILGDYREACLIRDLSPKASATLSRRCLQGMIRDFWRVSKKRLVDEIEAIKDLTDPLTWQAVDAVRKIGNIGAHMEADIDLIVDVEPQEASLLIELIETLLNDWYVTRHEREARLNRIVDLSESKQAARRGARNATPAAGEESGGA